MKDLLNSEILQCNKILEKVSKRKNKGISGLEICILICNLLRPSSKQTNKRVTPEQFWNASSRGELFHVYSTWEYLAEDLFKNKYKKLGIIIPENLLFKTKRKKK